MCEEARKCGGLSDNALYKALAKGVRGDYRVCHNSVLFINKGAEGRNTSALATIRS